MIKELKVTNFAIIEDIDIKFNDKFTTLTGETGAGKSLLIDTISLLLGERSNSDMIRYGEDCAKVYGVFSHNSNLDDIFKSLNIKISDEITIYREIRNNSRNVIKVNDTNVTLLQLKMISIYIASIHVQNDTYKLFNQDTYLSFIDPTTDKNFDKLMNNYSKDLYNYLNQYDVYDKILKSNKNRIERLDFLKYEKNELESLNLTLGIDKELDDKIQVLSNFDKIKNNLIEAYNSLTELPVIDNLYDSASNLNKIEEYDLKYKEYSEKIYDSYYILEDIKNN
ncbi:MAG: AAA family ATPase, partial [Acholeplasmatales bacterium]|nr:AAA family ATPase [Acholeplasmatales bacterium]